MGAAVDVERSSVHVSEAHFRPLPERETLNIPVPGCDSLRGEPEKWIMVLAFNTLLSVIVCFGGILK